jgi:hypothetical protein
LTSWRKNETVQVLNLNRTSVAATSSVFDYTNCTY